MENSKKLSPYTIAKNCIDKNDLNEGISELKKYFNYCEKKGKKPTNTALIRYSKLLIKKDKL